MSRTLAILIAVFILLGAFLIFRFTKESSSGTAVNTEKEETLRLKSTGPEFHKWREFQDPAGHFKVLLPGLPQHATDMITDPKTNEMRKYETFITADDLGQAFMISIITFPKAVNEVDLDDTLKSVVNEMINRNKDNKIQGMQFGNFRDHKALNFSLTNGDVLIDGKVFADHDTLYVLSILSKSEDFNETELSFFVNSFEITPKKNINIIPSKAIKKK